MVDPSGRAGRSLSGDLAVRAEPVSALYDDGLVHHVGVFDELETEMTTWRPGDSESQNRMDAMVWVISELMLGTTGGEVSADVI